MKLFAPLYEKVLTLSAHQHAPKFLAGLSFAESSFFPIPPDVMLIPMALAKPKSWKYFALLATMASVFGGVLGYMMGFWLFDWLMPYLNSWGYQETIALTKSWFAEWGIWVVFIAGFSPIPYKVFTITAGALAMAFIPFVIASFIGRGARFFLVTGLVAYFGHKMEPLILKYIERLGWFIVLAFIILVLYLRML